MSTLEPRSSRITRATNSTVVTTSETIATPRKLTYPKIAETSASSAVPHNKASRLAAPMRNQLIQKPSRARREIMSVNSMVVLPVFGRV